MSTAERLFQSAETRAFVGRTAELARLRAAGDAARIAYVHGVAGCGKSALLRAHARWCEEQGAIVVWADSGLAEPGVAGIEQALRAELAPSAAAGTAPDVWDLLREASLRARVLVCVDDYDRLDSANEHALRARMRQHLTENVAFVLAGRQPPARLWSAAAPQWRLTLQDIPLGGLGRAEAIALLQRMDLGLSDPVYEEIFACGAGNPGLMVLAGQAWRDHCGAPAGGGPASPPSEAAAGFILEQILHPGSRRRRWRAGHGEAASLDTLLAAAAVLPSPLREFLPLALPVDALPRHHTAIQDNPLWQGADGGDGARALHPLVRGRIAAAVERQRPWAARYWRRRALVHVAALVQGQPAAAQGLWRMAAGVVADYRPRRATPGAPEGLAAATSPDHPEGWEAERAALEGCLGATVSPRASQAPSGHRGHIVIGLGPAGRGIVARRHGAGGFRCPSCATVGGPGGADSGGALAPCIEALDAVAADAWHLCTASLAVPPGEGDGNRAGLPCSLLARSADEFAGVQRIVWVASPDDHLPRRLGFSGRPAAAGGHAGERPRSVHVLEPPRLDAARWLEGVLREPPLPPGLRTAAEQLEAAKEALEAYHDGGTLARTRAGAFAAQSFHVRTATALRLWLTDMVAIGDLNDGIVSGREALTRYYIAKSGPHSAVAADLAVARATYYRSLRQALATLAAALFA